MTKRVVARLPVTVVAGQMTSVTVTMASTIDRVEITPANPAVAVGETATLTMTAYDASNAVVLCWPNDVTWLSAADGRVAVTSPGITSTARGVASGASLPTVTETESGRSATTTVTVRTAARGLADTPWPKAHGDRRNSGLGVGGPRPAGIVQWSFNSGYALSDAAIGADGTLYMATLGKLHALSPDNGQIVWSVRLGSGSFAQNENPPSVSANGTVYVAQRTFTGSFEYPHLYAMDIPSRSVAWTMSFPYTGSSMFGTPAIAGDGVILWRDAASYPTRAIR